MSESQGRIWEYYQSRAPEIFDENAGRLRFILRHIPHAARTLDIGVGNGSFELAAQRKGLDLYALDPSEDAVRQLRRRLDLGERIRTGVAQQIPFPDRFFDAVVMSEVLEHLDDQILHASLREIARVLKLGGAFLGTVPARENLSESLVVCPHCGASFHRWGHQRAFTPETLGELLGRSFLVRRILERKFISLERRRGIAKVAALCKLAANRVGVRMPNESLFFQAENTAPPRSLK